MHLFKLNFQLDSESVLSNRPRFNSWIYAVKFSTCLKSQPFSYLFIIKQFSIAQQSSNIQRGTQTKVSFLFIFFLFSLIFWRVGLIVISVAFDIFSFCEYYCILLTNWTHGLFQIILLYDKNNFERSEFCFNSDNIMDNFAYFQHALNFLLNESNQNK